VVNKWTEQQNTMIVKELFGQDVKEISIKENCLLCASIFLEKEVYVLSPIAMSLVLRLELYEGDSVRLLDCQLCISRTMTASSKLLR